MTLPLVKLARGFLGLALVVMLIFLSLGIDKIRIETDLTSLVPETKTTSIAGQGISDVAEDFQKRIAFLLSSNSTEITDQAAEQLKQKINDISGISLLDNEKLLDKMQDFFARYRFQLLTSEQQRLLQTADIETLAQQAIRAKYSFSSTPQILPIAIDPLAWHSEYVLDVASNFGVNTNNLPESMQVVTAAINGKTLSMDSQSSLAEAIEKAEAVLRSGFPALEIYHSGVFFHAIKAARDSQQDISRISTISTIAIILILLLTFRSLWALVIPVSSIIFGIGFGFVVTHLVFTHVHVITIVFGASLIGVVIDYSLHYFFHGQDNTDTGGDNSRVHLHRALLLSLVTSLVGYSALGLSHLDVLAQVAVFSCAGMIMAMMTVIGLCPLVAARIAVRDRVISSLVAVFSSPWRLLPRRVVYILPYLLVSGGLVSAVLLLKEQNDPSLFLNPDPELVEMERFVSEKLDQYEPGSFVLIEGEKVDDLYRNTENFFQRIKASSNFKRDQFFSVTDLLPSPKIQTLNYELQARLYRPGGVLEIFLSQLPITGLDSLEVFEQYQSARSQSATPEEFLHNASGTLPPLWFSGDQGAVNIILLRKGIDLPTLKAMLQGADFAVYYRAVEATGEALRSYKDAAIYMLACAYGFVALFLLWIYRRKSALAVVVIPLCGAAVILLTFGLFDIALNLFHVMALFLSLGLGLDYGIFVYEMKDNRNLATQAIAVSAVTSLMSFGLLAASDIPVVHSFGLTLLIANGVNFFGSLIFARELNRAMLELQGYG